MEDESPDDGFTLQVPNRDVSVAATTKTKFRIRTDGQSVAGRSIRDELALEFWRRLKRR